MESFRTRDATEEKVFLEKKEAPHQESKQSEKIINQYSIQDVQLSAQNGPSVDVKRVRVIKRVKAADPHDILDPENLAGFTDYYNVPRTPDEEKKFQIALHFTAGALCGSIGILTAGRHHPARPDVGVHYLVSTKGTIFEMVEDKNWGNSSSAGGACNMKLVSIEIINPGPLLRVGDDYHAIQGGGFVCDKEEAKDWVYDLGKPYRGYSLFYKYTPAQYDALRRLLAYIGAKHAIPLKLLDDDHPEAPELSKRYRCSHEIASAHHGIVSHVNYCAEGKWDIGPAFEWNELFEKAVVFPFQARNEPISNPVSVYYNNETHDGGSFVAGATYNVHGGIHLSPAGPRAPVKAMAPGVIVAARLAPADADAETLRFTGNHNGFVLLKHMIQEKDAQGRDKNAPFPIYSLYMHLAYPTWSGDRTEPYADVPWVRRLLQAQNGVIVDLRSAEATFGEILWVKTKTVDKNTTTCSVYKAGSMDAMAFPLVEQGRPNGVFKTPPDELRRGYEGVKDGKIITFHLPYLFVAQGEILGHIAPVTNPRSPSPFLHWEIFSPAGPDSGLRKLLALEPGIKARIKDVVDTSEDNFLDETDFKNLLKPLAQQERDLIQAILNEHGETYGQKLYEKRARHQETFSATKTVDVAGPSDDLFYVVDLDVRRKSEHCAVEPGTYNLDLEFIAEDDTVLPYRSSVPVVFGSEDNKTVHVPVPAAAAKLVVSSANLFIDGVVPPQAASGANPVADDLRLLREDLLDYRWRNVLLEHVTEWSQAGLTKLFRDHANAVRPFTLQNVLPITWWARTSGQFGELPVLGDGTSIFSKGILPQDGKIHNLHPVTALWLLHALLDHGRITFAAEPTRFEGLQDPTVMYRGWTAVTGKVGDPLFALAIRKDFNSKDTALFTAKGPDEELTLGTAQYGNGVAKLAATAGFWGKWELKVPSKAPAQRSAHDNVAQWWNDLTGGSAGPTTIEVAPPKLANVDMPERVPNSASYTLRLQFADNCPRVMHGLVFFKCARAAGQPGQQPAEGPAPAADSFVLCPKALVVAAAKVPVEVNGIKYETSGGYRFLTGLDGKRASPLASPHISLKFYQDAWKRKEAFKLSLELVRRVERLLCLWDRRSVAFVTRRLLVPTALTRDGLSLTLAPAFRWGSAGTDKAQAEASEFQALVEQARDMERHPWEPIKVAAVDETKRQLTIAVEHTLPRPDTGDLVARFDPGPLVDDFVTAAGGQAGDRIFVSAGFYGPNGGEYAIAGYKYEAADIVELSSEVQGRIARGERGVVAQPPGAAPLLTFDDVVFASTGASMACDAVEIYAVGGGLAAMWEKIQVEISIGGARFACARSGARFSAQLKEKVLQSLGVIGTSPVRFDVTVAQGGGIRYGATQTPVQVNLKPSLDSLKIVEPAKMTADDRARAVFGQVLGAAEEHVCLLGRASCMPTDAWLELNCFVGSSADRDLTHAVACAFHDHNHPVCDKDGYFAAWIRKQALRKRKGVEIRFVWSRKGQVWGQTVNSPASAPAVRVDGEQIVVMAAGGP